MQAAVVHQLGQPLVVGERLIPTPAPGQIEGFQRPAAGVGEAMADVLADSVPARIVFDVPGSDA